MVAIELSNLFCLRYLARTFLYNNICKHRGSHLRPFQTYAKPLRSPYNLQSPYNKHCKEVKWTR